MQGCSIILHFILVLTVCQSTLLGVSSIHRINVLSLKLNLIYLNLGQYFLEKGSTIVLE